MQLIEVKRENKALVKEFLELPVSIYKDDPNWIRPLDQDIEQVFNPDRNKFWRHGHAIRWVLRNDAGQTIGRVAAFINKRTLSKEDQPTGGMGFFECIRDEKAAFFLFDACKKWLADQGIEAMDGPINFGERDSWWGVLADGFHPPVYQMNYNPPCYVEFFTNYGFEIYFKQYVLYRNVMEPMTQRFIDKRDLMNRTPGYHFKTIDKRQLAKFAEDFRTIYNNAWGKHAGFKQMRKEQAMVIMKKLKPILAPELAIFGYFKEEPIAFFIMIPDMNQMFKGFNGKFGLVQKLKTWWMLKRKATTKCYGIVFGIVPEHQGKGVDGGLIGHAADVLHPMNHWEDMEMTWIGDFNPKMLNIAKDIGGEIYKTYYTMRYLFDREKEFKRHPIIG